MQHMGHVAYRTCVLYLNYSFRNILLLIHSDDALRLILETSFIGYVQPSYAPPFTLIVLSENHRSIFGLEDISSPCIIFYPCLPCN